MQFWKIYFWIIAVISALGFIGILTRPSPDSLLFLLYIPEVIALYGYAYERRFFTARVWKIYFFIDLAWLIVSAYTFKTSLDSISSNLLPFALGCLIFFLILLIPTYIGLYFYAFRFMNVKVESNIPTSSDIDANSK